jgi:hypothetical protein
MDMKAFKALLTASVFIALAIGCSTTSTKDRESMLSAAGFKMITADTPEKEAHLKSLPANEITTVKREGIQYYVFPSAGKNNTRRTRSFACKSKWPTNN